MSASKTALEDERRELLRQVMQLGGFRPGSISTIQGRCGEPACRCHQPGQPPHGPHFRLTRKVRGKTVSETFSSPAVRRKAQREVGQFHRFQHFYWALTPRNLNPPRTLSHPPRKSQSACASAPASESPDRRLGTSPMIRSAVFSPKNPVSKAMKVNKRTTSEMPTPSMTFH